MIEEGVLAGEETLTGSSMYAGSPAPHLLQAVTLNRYSLASTTSVTVCSRSRIPVATCGREGLLFRVGFMSIRVCVLGGGADNVIFVTLSVSTVSLMPTS